MYDAREDCLVSVHEAGHSIAAAEFGFHPTEAQIILVRQGLFKIVGCGFTTLGNPNLAEKFKLAIVCYVGAAAEALVPHYTEGTHYGRALEDAVEAGAWDDYHTAEDLYAGHPWLARTMLPRAQKEAIAFAVEHWVEIEFVGQQLRIQRHVNYTPDERVV